MEPGNLIRHCTIFRTSVEGIQGGHWGRIGAWDGGSIEGKYIPNLLKGKDIDEIAEIWTEEFCNGVAGTNVKPAYIKIALGDTGVIIGFQDKLPLNKFIWVHADVDMNPEGRNEISSLSVTPATATDRGETLLPMWA